MAWNAAERARPMVVAIAVVLVLLTSACRASDESLLPEQAQAPTDSADDSADASDDGDGLDQAEGRDASDAADSGAQQPLPTPAPPADPPSNLPRQLTASDVVCSSPSADDPVSLTARGELMLARHIASGGQVPSYQLAVDVNPETGQITGAMRAEVPAQDRTINFRAFAGMEAFGADLQINNATVNGAPVDATLDRALLSLPAASVDDGPSIVELDFSFTIAQMAANENIFGALTGDTLQPDQVGLLGRTESGMQLGHWFPVWLPDGIRTDPDPAGFGDIGAFPAANICATITVPSGYEVVTSGTRTETTDTSIVEAGAGLRDFSILISNDLLLGVGIVDGTEIRVWGPSDNPDAVMTVLEYAKQSQEVLTQAFGPYPWEEIDIISAPLGAGVGGMEWPGAVWIERSMFGGGLPGIGDLGDAFGEDFDAILESIGGAALSTSLEWTVAHELGHEWWHATVGNDSIESPAVDEPLAQFSACLAMESIHPENWREICDAQTTDQYAQARSLGVNDTAAEQASDEFESPLQYGAVVYGKAPGFYYAAAELLGWDQLTEALRSFVADNSFALVSTDTLRTHLVDAAGDDGPAIADLWDRWFRQAVGDEDIEPVTGFGGLAGLEGLDGLGGLEGFEDFDFEDLLGEDFESVFGADFDFEALFGEDFDPTQFFGEDMSIDELLEDFLDATEAGD